jgi:cell division protein FtsI (penicillin-binding protein 3)
MSTCTPNHRTAAVAPPIHLEGSRARALETARTRLMATGLVFAALFMVVVGRLVDLGALDGGHGPRAFEASAAQVVGRGDIVDRNGILLATSLPTESLYADPQEISDPKAVVDALGEVLPDLDRQWLLAKLSQSSRFVWIRRNLTPEEQYAVNRLGIPGLAFQTEYRRVYPRGAAAAHVLGLTDVDEQGIAGVEQAFDALLANGETLRLSLDMRIQHMLGEHLAQAMTEFEGIGAAGAVLDVETGELLALISLPDFDPNLAASADEDARFNRVTNGVYELGSVFKLFTAGMALDAGVTTLQQGYDATRPLRVARHTIADYRPKKRWLSVPEILVYSSNIGAALMAEAVGPELQRRYLAAFGLMDAAALDLPEVANPLLPRPWRDIDTMTAGFGHGIAVTPLQVVSGVGALVNGGLYRPATLLRQDGGGTAPLRRVVSEPTSEQMRALMRLVVRFGTASGAEVPGYDVGGKTGTAEKLVDGRYDRQRRVSSFIGAFPMDAPRYVVFAMVDEPKGIERTHNFATGGWVAAPVVGQVIERMAPLLAIAPRPTPVEPAIRTAQEREQRLTVAIQDLIANSKGQQLALR